MIRTRHWRRILAKRAREFRGPLIAILVLCAAQSSLANWYSVPTGSMKPTILEGERIVVNRMAYDLRIPFTNWSLMSCGAPQRGDIVVLTSPADGVRLVKRVIGLPGDSVAMWNNRLWINGEFVDGAPRESEALQALDVEDRSADRALAQERLGGHPHDILLTANRRSIRNFGPVRVPPGQYFVMGDNRDESLDSRYFGFVEAEQIQGRAFAVATSFDADRWYLPRWKRFFTALP